MSEKQIKSGRSTNPTAQLQDNSAAVKAADRYSNERLNNLSSAAVHRKVETHNVRQEITSNASSIAGQNGLRSRYDVLESVIDMSPVGIVIVDQFGKIVFANQRAENILGLSKDEITQRTYNDPKWKVTAYDGSPFPDRELPFSRVMATRQPVHDIRHAIEWPNGRRVFLSINAAPFFDDRGDVQGMLVAVDDITDNVIANERMRTSEARFRSIVESSPMGIHMYQLSTDDRLVFIGANPAADRILRVDNRQFIGKSIEEAFPPLADTEIPERYRLAAAKGQRWSTENVDFRHGEIRGAYEVHAFQTSPGYVVALFTDITQRKKAELQERKYAEKLAFLADSAMRLLQLPMDVDIFPFIGERLYQLVGSAAYVVVSRYDENSDRLGASSLSGFGESTALLRKMLEQKPESMSVPLNETLRKTLLSGRLSRFEGGFHQLSNGTVSEETASALENALQIDKIYSIGLLRKGRILGSVAIITRKESEPLTISLIEAFVGQASVVLEKRLAEQERTEMEEQLLHVQKLEAIGTLAGGVAHDFNNLLTSMLGQTFILKQKTSPSSLQKESLDIIETAALRAADLTRQLLGFARKGKMRSIPVDLTDIIKDVVALMKHTVDKRILIVYDPPSSLPQIVGDPGQLHQVFVNLAVNARDAITDAGQIRFTVDIISSKSVHCTGIKKEDEKPADQYVMVTVSDTGTGIETESLNRIFEPFFTTKELGKGTGMGLAVVYGIVRSHQGWIDVSSEEGKGSCFSVYLPAASQEHISRQPISSRPPELGQGRILIVDDEELVRRSLGELLRTFGYEVEVAATANQGLEFLYQHSQKIDLVLLDYMMPDMDGLTCYRTLRKRGIQSPVIVVTGHCPDNVSRALLDEGVLSILQKPFNTAVLSRKIKEALAD